MSRRRRGRGGGRLSAEEGWASVASSPARSLLVALAAAALAAAVVAMSLTEVAAIGARFREQVAEGRFVLVSRSASRDGLDAARCEALRDLPGVTAAGAVIDERQVYPLASPLRPYDLLTVTPGLLGVWFPDAGSPDRPGWLVGPDVAAELGLVGGSVVQVAEAGSPTHLDLPVRAIDRRVVGAVLPPALRLPSSGRILFSVARPTGTTDACFVDPDPSARAAVEAAMVGWFGAEQAASVTPLLDERATGRQPESELATRTSRWVWSVAAAAMAALTASLWYGRREEFALYRLLGRRRTAIATHLTIEALLTVAVPSLIGGTLALLACRAPLTEVSRSDGGVPALLALVEADAASFGVALTLVPLLGFAVVGWRSTFDVLKGS